MLHHRHPDSSFGAPLAEEEYLCWTKMQAEAGQAIEAILSRKERERRAGNGLFMWGVGNAPALLINTLARLERPIPVVFSLMKSKPKAVDTAPAKTLVWRRYIDSHGFERDLPENVIVTSRGSDDWTNKRHYALMCYSASPLQLRRGEGFNHHAYRNASGTGAPVGASQVTSLLRPVGGAPDEAEYEVNFRAELIDSYWVRLADPALVSSAQAGRLAALSDADMASWLSIAQEFRHQPSIQRGASQERLFI